MLASLPAPPVGPSRTEHQPYQKHQEDNLKEVDHRDPDHDPGRAAGVTQTPRVQHDPEPDQRNLHHHEESDAGPGRHRRRQQHLRCETREIDSDHRQQKRAARQPCHSAIATTKDSCVIVARHARKFHARQVMGRTPRLFADRDHRPCTVPSSRPHRVAAQHVLHFIGLHQRHDGLSPRPCPPDGGRFGVPRSVIARRSASAWRALADALASAVALG